MRRKRGELRLRVLLAVVFRRLVVVVGFFVEDCGIAGDVMLPANKNSAKSMEIYR